MLRKLDKCNFAVDVQDECWLGTSCSASFLVTLSDTSAMHEEEDFVEDLV